MKNINISIDGKSFTNWSSLTISKSVSSLCHSISIEVSDPLSSNEKDIVKSLNSTIIVNIGKDRYFTGYLHSSRIDKSHGETKCYYMGRSKTQDLLDCSVVIDGFRIAKKTPSEITRIIASAFLIETIDNNNGKVIDEFSIQPGESAYEAITRANKSAGIHTMTDQYGNIVLVKPPDEITEFFTITENTKNIISRHREIDLSSRYSEIKSVSQAGGSNKQTSAGVLFSDTPQSKLPIGRVSRDSIITRYRPLIVDPGDDYTSEQLTLYSQFKRNQFIGESDTIKYTFNSIEIYNGSILHPYTVARINDPYLQISADYIVDDITLEVSFDSGIVATVSLRPPQSFCFEPFEQYLKKKTKRKRGKTSLSPEPDLTNAEIRMGIVRDSIKNPAKIDTKNDVRKR